MEEYIEIIHTNQNLTTLSEFIDFHLIKNMTEVELLNFEDNSDSIYNSYLPEDRVDNPSASISLLRTSTSIKVPVANLEKEIIQTQNNIVYDNGDFRCFIDSKIGSIINDRGYIRTQTPILSSGQLQGDIHRLDDNATVWIWVRSLDRVIDATPFLNSINMNVNDSGGNFSFQMAPVKGVFDGEKWEIDENSINQFFENQSKQYVSRVSIMDTDFDQTKFFFNNIISSNDVVFIRFEKLESDPAFDNKDIQVDVSKIHSTNWDMIGLVDSNRLSHDAATSDISIEVGGRDLIKILIEDGTYFFPLDVATNSNDYFNNTGTVRGGGNLERLITGELNFFNAYLDRTIEFSLKFIFNLLSNVRVCSDMLFSYYPKEELTYRYDFYTPDNKVNDDEIEEYEDDVKGKIRERNNRDEESRKSKLRKEMANGIWRIVKLVIDPNIQNRRLADTSLTTEQGSLLNFVNKVVQQPFAEFYSDTYGSQFYFIARRPPTDLVGFNSNYVIDINESDIYTKNLNFNDENVFSWYRLIPRGNFFGDRDNLSLYYLPAVYFEKYAEIWGSRPLEVVTNYIDYEGLKHTNTEVNLSYLQKQSQQDLAYIIESNAYNPFIRTGQVTIRGDRRIKRGMNVRLTGTGEIFHVDAVNNFFDVNGTVADRTTTLTLSRGMVEKYTLPNEKYNYFKIIKQINDGDNIEFKLDEEVFEFFIKRKQFQ